MKFTVNTKDILKALQAVGGIIKSPNQMPILDNVLFILEGGKLQIIADNLEIRSTIEMPITAQDSLSVCIPYQDMVSILKGFPNAPIDFVFEDRHVLIQNLNGDKINGEYKIPTEKAEEFPKNKFELSGEKAAFNSLDFVEAIRKASAYIDDKSMNGMSNCLVWIRDIGTRIVGGNGFLVYECSLDVKGEEKKLLLSKSVVSYLAQSITEEEAMEISYTDNHIFFTLEGRQISAILGNIAYPDYETVFNKVQTNKTLNVDKDSLLPALRRLCNVTDKNSIGIEFNFNNESLEMSFRHVAQKCDAKENIAIDYEGEPLMISLNGNQVLGALQSLDGDVKIKMSEPMKACMITGENTRCLTMPMKPSALAAQD